MAVSRADVEELGSKGWKNLDNSKKDALLSDAKAERDTIYSDKVATLPILEGDTDVFTKNLAAHKWELAEGGEPQSESGTGGSVNYQVQTTQDLITNLGQTRYGREALKHLRNKTSIGFVRTY